MENGQKVTRRLHHTTPKKHKRSSGGLRRADSHPPGNNGALQSPLRQPTGSESVRKHSMPPFVRRDAIPAVQEELDNAEKNSGPVRTVIPILGEGSEYPLDDHDSDLPLPVHKITVASSPEPKVISKSPVQRTRSIAEMVGTLLRKLSPQPSDSLGADETQGAEALTGQGSKQRNKRRVARSWKAVRSKMHALVPRNKGRVADSSILQHGITMDDEVKGGVVAMTSSPINTSATRMANRWRLKSATKTLLTLAPFVPTLLQDTIKDLEPLFHPGVRSSQDVYTAVSKSIRPSMTTFKGAVMVADVTGFTKLTEILSKKGTSGVELLTKCINSYFAKAIDIILDYGGDVVKFAGDSLIVAFYPTDQELEHSDDEGFAAATLRCVGCANRLANRLGQMRMLPNGDVFPIPQMETRTWYKQKLLFQVARAFAKAGEHNRSRSLVAKSLGSSPSMGWPRQSRSKAISPAVEKIIRTSSGRNGHVKKGSPPANTRQSSKVSVIERMRSAMVPRQDSTQTGINGDELLRRLVRAIPGPTEVVLRSSAAANAVESSASSLTMTVTRDNSLQGQLLSMRQGSGMFDAPNLDEHDPEPLEMSSLKHATSRNPRMKLDPLPDRCANGKRALDSGDYAVQPVLRKSELGVSFDKTTNEARGSSDPRPIGEGHEGHSGCNVQDRAGSGVSGQSSQISSVTSSWGTFYSKSHQIPSFGSDMSRMSHTGRNPIVRLSKRMVSWLSLRRTSIQERDESTLAPPTPDHSDNVSPLRTSKTGSSAGRLKTATLQMVEENIMEREGSMDENYHPMALKVLVGAGTVCVFRVGGLQEVSRNQAKGVERWEFFIGDRPHVNEEEHGIHGDGFRPPFRQIADIEEHANSGDVIVSQEVIRVVGQHFRHEPLGGDAGRVTNMLSTVHLERLGKLHRSQNFSPLPERVQYQCAAILRMHVTDYVRQRIEAGHIDFINEIRRLSVLFLGFPAICEPGLAPKCALTSVQSAVEVVQKQMREFEGTFLQFRCDEKGFLGICAFGLQGRNHEDNCSRAIMSALKISKSMRALGSSACVGVTTGDLLCACVGSRTRAEYTVFGDAINLSARLMCKAKRGLGEILCDHATYTRAKREAHYVALEPLPVKGKKEPVRVYSVEPLTRTMRNRAKRTRNTTLGSIYRPLVGRQDVIDKVQNAIARLVKHQRGGALLIEGGAGMGKSKLAMEIQQSDFDGLRFRTQFYFGSGDSAFKFYPLYPWRRIFGDMFHYDRMVGLTDRRERKSIVPNFAPKMMRAPSTTENTSKLGLMLQTAVEDYNDVWRPILADALELAPESLPVGAPLSNDKAQGNTSESMSVQRIQAIASFIISMEKRLNSRPTVDKASPPDKSNLRTSSMERVHSVDEVLNGDLEPCRMTSKRQLVKSKTSLKGGRRVITEEENHPVASKTTEDVLDGNERPMGTSHPSARVALLATQDTFNSSDEMESNDGGTGALRRCTTKRMEMTGALKQQRLLDLLVEVCRLFIQLHGPIVILLEDIHHFDTMSWTLLNAMVGDLHYGCLAVATMRPNDGSLSPQSRGVQGKDLVYGKTVQAYEVFCKSPSTKRICLTPLSVEEVRNMMEIAADGEEVSDAVVAAVLQKTSGIPMFVEQMTLYLKQRGLLGTNEAAGAAALSSDSGLTDFIRNTVTLNHMLMQQMDQLRPSAHLTLKVAAVVEKNITAEILKSVYPFSTASASLERDLKELEQGGFLTRCPEIADICAFKFNTMVGRDIVYELIPHFQRKSLHAKVATALINCTIKVPYTTIAYHWEQSCKGAEAAEWKRAMCAMEWWEKAANQALEKSAKVEARRLFQKAADIADCVMEFYSRTDSHNATAFSLLVNSAADTSMESPDRQQQGSAKHSQPSSSSDIQIPHIPALVRVRWESKMAQLCIDLTDSTSTSDEYRTNGENARKHIFKALLFLGAPLPGQESDEPGTIASWCFGCDLCGSTETIDDVPRRRRPSWGVQVRNNLSIPQSSGSVPLRVLSAEEIAEGANLLNLLLQTNQLDAGMLGYCSDLVAYFCKRPSGSSPFHEIERIIDTENRKLQVSMLSSFTKRMRSRNPGNGGKG